MICTSAPREHLLAKHRSRLQTFYPLLLTTNISNKSGNLLLAQAYPEWYEKVAFLHSSCTVSSLVGQKPRRGGTPWPKSGSGQGLRWHGWRLQEDPSHDCLGSRVISAGHFSGRLRDSSQIVACR